MKTSSSKTNGILTAITVVSILFGAFSSVGYIITKQDSQVKIENVKEKKATLQKNKDIEIKDQKAQISDLNSKLTGKKAQETESNPQQVMLDGYTKLADKFARGIIGNTKAANIRKSLEPIASDSVIDKMAPVDSNEKYDSKITPSKIKVSTVESYIKYDSLTDSDGDILVICNYTIDKTKLSTKMQLHVKSQDGKLIITDASYLLNNPDTGSNE